MNVRGVVLASGWIAAIAAAGGSVVSAAEIVLAAEAPAPDPALLASRWPARWIAPPDVSLSEYGVFLFRKHIALAEVPERYVVHVSADNRYRLFVNGTLVSHGPQRGDQMHWHFDTLDLRDHLRAGTNVLAVQVWNFGEERPYALMSLHTGLIVQGDGELEQGANTGDEGWRVQVDHAFAPLPGFERAPANLHRRRSGRADRWRETSVGLGATGV